MSSSFIILRNLRSSCKVVFVCLLRCPCFTNQAGCGHPNKANTTRQGCAVGFPLSPDVTMFSCCYAQGDPFAAWCSLIPGASPRRYIEGLRQGLRKSTMVSVCPVEPYDPVWFINPQERHTGLYPRICLRSPKRIIKRIPKRLLSKAKKIQNFLEVHTTRKA